MDTLLIKHTLSLVAVLLTVIAYVPYYRDIIRGKTHPHVYSWTLWLLLGMLIVALQLKGGAGAAAYVTLAAALLCLGVIILGLKHGKRDITRFDTAVAVLALVAMVFWLVVNQPVISVIFAVMADLLAFVPTVRKSWHKPHTETISMYVTNALRFSLVLLALESYNVLSVLWPAAWVLGNALFATMLILRRRAVA